MAKMNREAKLNRINEICNALANATNTSSTVYLNQIPALIEFDEINLALTFAERAEYMSIFEKMMDAKK